jgi:hypothetical protein
MSHSLDLDRLKTLIMSYVKSNSNEKTKRSDSKQKSSEKIFIKNPLRKVLKFADNSKRSKYLSSNPNYDEGTYEIVHYTQPTYEDILLKQQRMLVVKFLPNRDQMYAFDPKVKFSDVGINSKLNEIMKELLKVQCPNYSAVGIKSACQLLSERAKALVKSQKLNRYRFVVDVFAAQKAGQSILMASRCLCSENTDYYVNEVFEAEDYIVSCTIYGLYKA